MTIDDVGTNDGDLRTVSVPIDFVDRFEFRVLCAPRIVSSVRVYVAAPLSYCRDLNFRKAENNVLVLSMSFEFRAKSPRVHGPARPVFEPDLPTIERTSSPSCECAFSTILLSKTRELSTPLQVVPRNHICGVPSHGRTR